MNRRSLMCAAMLAGIALSGCERKQETAAKAEAPHATADSSSGEVRLPADSPQLKRIKVAVVEAATVPLDEVVAPGKIESNPNRISKVVMPVAGRVTRVMVAVGDAVTEGQPLLTI